MKVLIVCIQQCWRDQTIPYMQQGWLEGGLSTGFEKLIMDADRLGSYQKFLGQGLDLGPDAFARDAYEQVAPGGISGQ